MRSAAVTRGAGWAAVFLAAGLAAGVAAQEPDMALSYAEAQARFLDRSDAIDAADAAVRAAEARRDATRTLGRPEVEVEAQVLDFQKTLFLPLGSLEPVANAFGIADPLRFRIRRFVSRPIVTATVPIYAGGQMAAARAGAASRVAIEEASREEASEQGLAQLARTYFGRQLAAQALTIRQAVVAGISDHVADARALEREQQIAPAQRLQAEAQLEQAQREAEKAAADLAAADIALEGLLRAPLPIEPTTPLAVSAQPLPPRDTFIASAFDHHPGLNRLEANVRLAGAGVTAEQAQLRPTVYGLAQYNLDRQDTLVTDPDFIFGIGVKYKLASGMGRRAGVAAARSTEAQAEAGVREALVQIETGVKIAHAQALSTRKRHDLYGQTIAAADEARRVARLSFRELQGTSRDVTDAELAAGRVRVEQAQAAYEYLEALISLLEISGQMDRLPEFLSSSNQGTGSQ
ncbi:TolC family protein [Porphyrobacter sp. TH134]|uniref:TolC family protein n=1 Tax=Porphyrobacter sp. TH134 TaxID=2067450 RepID=UPI001551EE0E|nr:TolC family protein [Porphyrobacter sp. TH134]